MTDPTLSESPSTAAFRPPGTAALRAYFPVLLLVVICIIFAFLSPRFLHVQNLFLVLQQSAVLLVTALGMTFVIMAGSIDLSVGSTVALSALVAGLGAPQLGMFAVVPAVFVGLIAGSINGALVAWGKVPSFIVTLGAMVVFRGVVLLFTKGAPVSIYDESFLDVFGGRSLIVPNAAVISLGAAAICHILLTRSVFGREVKAVGGAERVAQLSGIRVPRVKLLMFAAAGVLAGIAGVLQAARTMAATAQLGQGLELDAIAAVVVGGTPLTGGIGGIGGTVLGALIITILSNGMNMVGVDPYLQNITKGVILVVAVFLTIDRSKIGVIK